MNIFKKKYSDLTVGEMVGWSIGVGFTILAIEYVTLKGITECVEDFKTAAITVRQKSDELIETFGERAKSLKTKIQK